MCWLNQELRQLKCKNVKIGASNGNGMIYCGPRKQALKDLEQLSNQYLKELKKKLAFKEDKLNRLDEILETQLKRYINPKKVKRTKEQIAAYKVKIAKRKVSLKKSLTKGCQSLTQKIRLFRPLLERNVVEVLDSIDYDEVDCKIIYIKGNEEGNFWTSKEYAYYKKNGKLPVRDTKTTRLDSDEIYKMATCGKYSTKEVLVKYDISGPTLQKILKEKREEIILKKGYKTKGELK